MNDLYQEITSSIIALMEQGVSPWACPWQHMESPGPHGGLPYSAATGAAYKGINVMQLWNAQRKAGYTSPAWIGFQQAKALGGSVRKGEKGTTGVFFQAREIEQKDREGKVKIGENGEALKSFFPIIRTFKVWNLDQIDGIDASDLPIPERTWEPHEETDRFMRESKADIRYGGNRAFCRRDQGAGFIQLPFMGQFSDADAFYATALHELTHWSGHPGRLDRVFGDRFGDNKYAMEEMVAEQGAAYLKARLGIKGEMEHHASYIKSWLEVLKADKHAIFTAARLAEQASEYLWTLVYGKNEADEVQEVAV